MVMIYIYDPSILLALISFLSENVPLSPDLLWPGVEVDLT